MKCFLRLFRSNHYTVTLMNEYIHMYMYVHLLFAEAMIESGDLGVSIVSTAFWAGPSPSCSHIWEEVRGEGGGGGR